MNEENKLLIEQNKYLNKNLAKISKQINYCAVELRNLKMNNKKLKAEINKMEENQEDELNI